MLKDAKQEANVDSDDVEKNLEAEDEDYVEKVNEKAPPGINASLVVLYLFFFALFTIGWVNLNNCPVSRLIPIYLIVAGSLGATAKFFNSRSNKYLVNISLVLVVLYCIWHGFGSYWVYKEYQPNYNYTIGIYCDRTTYLAAFWTLSLQYTVTGFIMLLISCYLIMRRDIWKN